MAEKCPLNIEHGSYVGPEIFSECLKCVAVAQEKGMLQHIENQTPDLTDSRLTGEKPEDIEDFELLSMQKLDESSRRVYIIQRFLASNNQEIPPVVTETQVYELDCRL